MIDDIRRKEADLPSLPNNVILNPSSEALGDLEAPEGNWINSVFEFRDRGSMILCNRSICAD